jgi:hypothetical protein
MASGRGPGASHGTKADRDAGSRPRANPGEVWIVDLGLAAKVPVLAVRVPLLGQRRGLNRRLSLVRLPVGASGEFPSGHCRAYGASPIQ